MHHTHNPVYTFISMYLLLFPYLLDLVLVPTTFHPVVVKPFAMAGTHRIPGVESDLCPGTCHGENMLDWRKSREELAVWD